MGPFDQWPTGGGFEYFYSFLGRETNQFDPGIYEGTIPVEPPKTAQQGYHFTEDMTDKAIAWARQQKALMGDKPFLMYFAPRGCHAPHHVPKRNAQLETELENLTRVVAGGLDSASIGKGTTERGAEISALTAKLLGRKKDSPRNQIRDPRKSVLASVGGLRALLGDGGNMDGAEGQNRTGYAGLFRAALYR